MKKGWIDDPNNCFTKVTSNNEKHAGSIEDTKANSLENWFIKQLLRNIRPNAVIVMNNASYYSRQLSRFLDVSSTITEIQNFLLVNNIFFEETEEKPAT